MLLEALIVFMQRKKSAKDQDYKNGNIVLVTGTIAHRFPNNSAFKEVSILYAHLPGICF